jgi:4-amino-4-deoxy-L-arabinose transferase-like glycosyltransferase
MFHCLNHRLGHYLLLLAAGIALTLPNLGVPSLWDIDEGHNAEAAREMLDSGNWLVPTFNFQLRDHKPPLLYWLQIAAYERFGVNEFAARLPSALAALTAVLLTYELGRLMFGSGVGFLAGLVLASAAMFCASAHFANPDALLDALTLATLFIFWWSMTRSTGTARLNGRGWLVPAGIIMGLAVLTKGPVGLLLPSAVIGLYVLWSRRLRFLLDYRLALGVISFVLVAVPWYAWIAAETKGEFTRGFFLTHNFGRFLSPMENHRGPIYYYVIALLLGFAPWSPFLILAVFYSLFSRIRPHLNKDKETRRQGDREKQTGDNAMAGSPCLPVSLSPGLQSLSPLRFLACWLLVYLVFFSLSGTKLPNYILPAYPAVAILTGRFLNDWRLGLLRVPQWAIDAGLIVVGLIGVVASLAILCAAGVLDLRFFRGRQVPGLEMWALVGLIPVCGALLAGWLQRTDRRTGAVISLASMAVLFVSVLAAWGSLRIDALKAPRPLVWETGAYQTERDIRIGCYQFYQPSVVFYCRREVRVLNDEDQVREFLHYPLPVYLFVSAQGWQSLQEKVQVPYRVLAHHRELYKGIDVLVITNDVADSAGQFDSFSR